MQEAELKRVDQESMDLLKERLKKKQKKQGHYREQLKTKERAMAQRPLENGAREDRPGRAQAHSGGDGGTTREEQEDACREKT